MVHRDVEEALNLLGVKVAGHHAVCPGAAQKVGNELGGNRNPRTVLAVLTGPAEVRHHRNNLVSGSPLGGIDAHQQFHQIVSGRGGGLNDEDLCATHAFIVLRLEFPITERSNRECTKVQLRFILIADFIESIDYFLSEVL